MTVVVNLVAGAGAGKSTLAAGLFYHLKIRGYCPELATEWVKEEAWAGNDSVVKNQIYIFAKQHRRIMAPFDGGADCVITDCPLFLSLFYNEKQERKNPELDALILAEHKRVPSINVFVRRQKRYDERGRWGTEADAIAADERMKQMLDEHGIEYIELDGNELAPALLANIVEEKLQENEDAN